MLKIQLDARRIKLDHKYDPTNLTLVVYDYDEFSKEKSGNSIVKGDEDEFDDLPPLEGDEEVKERKLLKTLTPNKILKVHFLKMMKNAFCFILKALFVLKIFKCFSWLFLSCRKMAWLER